MVEERGRLDDRDARVVLRRESVYVHIFCRSKG